MKLPFRIDGAWVEWGADHYSYYFGLGRTHPTMRRWGFERYWHDGPHCQFNLWFWSICWSTRWTLPPEEFRVKEPK